MSDTCTLTFTIDEATGDIAVHQDGMTANAYVALIEVAHARLKLLHERDACQCDLCKRAAELLDCLSTFAPSIELASVQ